MQHFVSLADEFHTFPDKLQNSCEIDAQLHCGCELPLSPPLRVFSVAWSQD